MVSRNRANRQRGSTRTGAQCHTLQSVSNLQHMESWLGTAGKIQWAIFGFACLLAFCLHIVLYRHTGAFWRDETSSIQLARASSWTAMWGSLETDSFPALFVSLLRLWIFTGPGATDSGIRLLGVLISLGIIVAAFSSCRTFVRRVPLLATALVAFNGTIFYYASSIRAYGLGALLIVLCFAAFWRLARNPTRWNIVVAFALATLSAHSNYQNCYLLFGIGTAACAVCAFDRLWKRSLLIILICFLAALSLTIYIPTIIRYRDFTQITFFSLELKIVGDRLAESLAGDSKGLLALWLVFLLSAIICPIVHFFYRRRTGSTSSALLPQFYCLLTLIVAGVSGFAFFKINGMFPFVWHYVPFIAILAVTVEINIDLLQHAAWISLAKAVLACTVVALSFLPAWEKAHVRRTDVDLVSAVISREAGPNDLVLVAPFWLAPGFNYYYHGSSEWTTLPAIAAKEKSRGTHYSAFKQLMMTPNAIEPTLQMIRKTLQAGNRLWIVGGIQFLPPNTAPPYLPPAPQSQFGWNNNAYTQAWVMQTGFFIQKNALSAQAIPISVGQPVSEMENLSLILIAGWRTR